MDGAGIFFPPAAILSTGLTVSEIASDIKNNNIPSAVYSGGKLALTTLIEKQLEQKILFFKYLPQSTKQTIIYNSVKLVIDKAGDAANPFKD